MALLEAILVVLSFAACASHRTPGELPIGHVDIPKPGASAKGSLRISGWAWSNAGIDRIDAYMDGKFAASSETGVSRPDVERVYPTYWHSENSGFDFHLDLSRKSAGTYELTVQARSKDDAVRELYRSPITVER